MSALRRRKLLGVARYTALIGGSALFLVPFAWLVLTSVKEDQDLSITDLSSVLPRVTETRSVDDPAAPAYIAQFKGREVILRETEAEAGAASVGAKRLYEVIDPKGLRGYVIEEAPARLRRTARRVNVIRTSDSPPQLGCVLIDMPDGSIVARMDDGRLQTIAAGAFEQVKRTGAKLENYTDALDYLPEETGRGLTYLRNTLTLAVMAVIGTLLSSSLAAYAFARLQFRGRRFLFGLLLSTMLLPSGVTLLPQFLIFRSLGWVDSLAPIWVPAFLGSAFNIFILRQFFASIPTELEDSARIDGCTPLRSYWSIMLPQVKPALVVIGVWTFIGAWNNFMGPLVYISSPENMPLSYALQLFHSERGSDPTLESAFALLTLLPVIAVFFVAQKRIMGTAALSGMGGR